VEKKIDKTDNYPRVAFYTLGCKLNFSETSVIEKTFMDKGFQKCEFGERADVVFINTCMVTSKAEKKCRNIIGRALRTSPDALVIVAGCYSQLNAEEIAAMPGVDLVLGSGEKFNVFDYIDKIEKKEAPAIYSCEIERDEKFYPAWSVSERTRSFLKIQDGCDYFCSYCTIPLARGRSRNMAVKDVLESVSDIAGAGVKEVVLTGVNIGDFGKTTGESFFELIKKLDQVKGVERFRISSIEPDLLTDEIIRFVSGSKKFAPHFHIPLQSGCNTILKKMNRNYTRELFASRVEKIRTIIPFAGVGADVITGFPGETEGCFEETLKFLKETDISYLHVFTYSEREHTRAARLTSKVEPKRKEERSKILHKLSDLKLTDFYRRNISSNSRQNVLFERCTQKGVMYGFTGNYIKVEAKCDPSLVNRLSPVELTGISQEGKVFCRIT